MCNSGRELRTHDQDEGSSLLAVVNCTVDRTDVEKTLPFYK